MRSAKFQFGRYFLAALLLVPGIRAAQKPHPDRPPQSAPQVQENTQRPANAYHPQANANRATANANQMAHPSQNPRPDSSYGMNQQNGVRDGSAAHFVQTPRQQFGAGAPRPWVDQMRDLSPRQRERVLQNSKAFQNFSPDKQARIRQQFNQWDRMTPAQQADLRQKESTWRNLTPEQREHIKNDVLPRWRQMPWDRQQVMKQKLNILQNMPESARNQRLNNPNFTRGMSDEEKSMLHDLSHTHVGAPDPPSE